MSKPEARSWFEGKSVAIVGSGPWSLDNEDGFIDSHDVVIRVNNYRLVPPATGVRVDCFYSFFGNSIRKTAGELKRDGVKLCMCKCPNASAIDSEWHHVNDKMIGVDFRWIYTKRSAWWFCDTYIPEVDDFLRAFNMLGRHIPTTGFSAIVDVLSFAPRALYITGFDFFRSGLHNVNEPWRAKNSDDPIAHVPERELMWLAENAPRLPIAVDRALADAMKAVPQSAVA